MFIQDLSEREEIAQGVDPDHDTHAAPIALGICAFAVFVAILFCASL